MHCNWISGLAAKRYLLTEAGLWGIPATPASGRYLTYDVGERGDALSLGGQLRALLAAMEFARHTNRTLVLPRFFIRSGPEGGPARGSERSFAYLFDYANGPSLQSDCHQYMAKNRVRVNRLFDAAERE